MKERDTISLALVLCRLRSRQPKFLGLLGHILRMEKDEPANIYALFEPSHGRRPQIDCISRFSAKSRNGSTPKSKYNILRTAQDHASWRCQLLFGRPMMMMRIMIMMMTRPKYLHSFAVL